MPPTAEAKDFVRRKQLQFLRNIAVCTPLAAALTLGTVLFQVGSTGIEGALWSMAEYMAYAVGGGAVACALAGLKG